MKKPLELFRGTLDVVILQTLSGGALHGYGISRWVRETTDESFSIEEGALYPALRRLEKKELIEASWGRTETGREARFYELTPGGRAELESSVRNWERYVDAMSRVLANVPGR